MSRQTRTAAGWGGALLLTLVAATLTCNQAIPTAPPGSSIQVFANPNFIPANGGVAVISAFILEPNGLPVADGTVVQFFTTLGRIDEQGRTNDGVARVNLVSDSRSGTADVCAISGGQSSGGGGGSPSPSASPAASPAALQRPARILAAAATASCSGAEVSVTIGSVRPVSMIVTAFPTHLTDKRASTITANVFDRDGNPVANVPVFFSVQANSAAADTESMDSQGTPTYTDNNGQARDVMRTKYHGADPKTVDVLACTPEGSTSASLGSPRAFAAATTTTTTTTPTTTPPATGGCPGFLSATVTITIEGR
jgi:hypothetical protein